MGTYKMHTWNSEDTFALRANMRGALNDGTFKRNMDEMQKRIDDSPYGGGLAAATAELKARKAAQQ